MAAYVLTIDGKAATAAGTFDVLNPADESVVARCPQGTPELVDGSGASARRALPLWSALPDAERAAKLMAIATLIEQHHPELSELVTREQGKTQSGPGANHEVGGAVAWTRVTAGLTMPEETIQGDTAASIVVHRKPAGVNQHGALHPLAPFGGVKGSGLGVEFNVDGLKEYTTIQVVNVAR